MDVDPTRNYNWAGLGWTLGFGFRIYVHGRGIYFSQNFYNNLFTCAKFVSRSVLDYFDLGQFVSREKEEEEKKGKEITVEEGKRSSSFLYRSV